MTDSIHTAVCQAVTIMNMTPGLRGTQPHNILREALMNYSEPRVKVRKTSTATLEELRSDNPHIVFVEVK